MKRALVLAKKELRDVLRERSIVLALITQAFVAAFSGFLTLGLVGLYDPETVGARPDLRIDYVGDGEFLQYLRTEGFRVTHAATADEAYASFQAGSVDVVVEETFLEANATRTVSLLLADGELETTLAVTRLKDVLRDYERDLRQEREERLETPVLYVTTSARANPYFGFAYAVLLPLLVLTPVFLAGATTADSIVQELATRTILILRSAPLTPLEIIVGKLLAPALLVPAQVLLWIFFLSLNGTRVSHIPEILLLSLILAVGVAAVTSMIAVVARREGPAQAAYTVFLMALVPVSLLLPQDPFNVLARLGADSANMTTYLSMGIMALFGALMLTIAGIVAARHLRESGE